MLALLLGLLGVGVAAGAAAAGVTAATWPLSATSTVKLLPLTRTL